MTEDTSLREKTQRDEIPEDVMEAAINAYREGEYLNDEQVHASVKRIVLAALAHNKALDGARELPYDRDTFGRFVREAWVRWAATQPDPKLSWLMSYDKLGETDKEADRQIGEAVARWTLIGDAARTSEAKDRRIKALEAERDERDAWIADATRQITKLTGGGSEFFTRHGETFRADITACCARIGEREMMTRERWLKAAKAEKAARTALSGKEGQS